MGGSLNNLGNETVYASEYPSSQIMAELCLEDRVSQVLPGLPEDIRKQFIHELKNFRELEDFFKSTVYDHLAKKEAKKLKEVVEEFLMKRTTEEAKKLRHVRGVVEAIRCTDETAEWICENLSHYYKLDDFLKQPELDQLSRKQLRLLKSHVESIMKFGMNSLEDQIEQKLRNKFGLSFDICREIVMTWKEGQSLEQLFESEVCEDITRKQGKDITDLLEKEVPRNSEEENELQTIEKQVTEIVTAIECSEEIARWVCENFHHFPIIEDLLDQPQLENLKNKQLKLLKNKLKSFNNFSSNSFRLEEETRIENQLNKEFGLDLVLCCQIVRKWRKGDTLEEIFDSDALEDVTRKQQKAIADILREKTPRQKVTSSEEGKFRHELSKTTVKENMGTQFKKHNPLLQCSSGEKMILDGSKTDTSSMTMPTGKNFPAFVLEKTDPYTQDITMERSHNKEALSDVRESLVFTEITRSSMICSEVCEETVIKEELEPKSSNDSFLYEENVKRGEQVLSEQNVDCLNTGRNQVTAENVVTEFPSEEIKKTLLLQSAEFLKLQNEISKIVFELHLPDDAKVWIDENLMNLENVDSLENCEFLTIKQLKILKKEVNKLLTSFVSLKQEIEGRVEKIPKFEANESLLIDKENEETNTGGCRSETVGSSICAELEQCLKYGADEVDIGGARKNDSEKADLERKKRIELNEDVACEQNEKFMDINGSKPLPGKITGETFPLITCADQSQGDRVVEQFLVRTENIKQLCNLKEGCENFYYDVSSGLYINFAELSNYALDLVGVLGRLANAKIFFQKILSMDSFNKLNETMAKEGSGIYLVVQRSLYSSEISESYLYFFSKNDEDYCEANQKSRAIHFLRYITQLTKNVFMLLDEKDAQLLAAKPSNAGKKKSKSQKYNVCQLELQKDDVKLEEIGSLKKPWTEYGCQQELHASNAGLYLISSRFQSPKTQNIATEKLVSVEDFKKYFSLKEIHESAEVCEEFKQKYVEAHHQDIHKEIENDAACTKAAFLENTEDNDLYKIIDFSIIQKVYKHHFTTEYKLMEKFFQITEKDEKTQKWLTALQFTFKLKDVISYNREQIIKDFMKDYTNAANSIEKLVLLQILEGRGVSHQKSDKIEALYTLAWNNYLIGDKARWLYPSKPQWSDASIQKSLVDGLEKTIATSARASNLEFHFNTRWEILEKITKFEVTYNRGLQNSIASFKRECLIKFVKPKIDEEKRRNFNQKFSEIEQLERMKESEQCENQRTKAIESIVLSTKLYQFKVKYTRTEAEESKMVLEMHKLTMRNSVRDNRQRQQDLHLEAKMLTFTNICRIETPQLENPKIFPINAGLALLTANCGKSSKVFVFGTSKGQQQLKFEFGKNILQSEFDTLNQILCLYSEYGDTKELNFYQFDAEYKKCSNYSRIDLFAKFNIQGVSSMKLQYGTKFVWVLESAGKRVLKLDIRNGTASNSSKLKTLLSEVGNFSHLHMAPNARCVFLSTECGELRAVMSETFNVLDDPLSSFAGREIFQLPESNISLVAHFEGSFVKFQKLTIQEAQQEMKLQESSSSIGNENQTEKSKQSKQDQKHWMYNLQWVFMKFPCEDIFQKQHKKMILTAICCDNSDINILSRQLNEIQHEIKTSLRMTFKPTKIINEKVDVMHLSNYLNISQKNSSEYIAKMDKFLLKLIGFTPMQIARCQSNEFLVIKDGVALSTESARDVFEMKENIDLGLFEAIFNWWSGNVKVVSSMGKQTTGKSYMLNHVMGSSFNISGARCTDGCWMTLNVQEDSLYVILDFEGLGSFERTDHDDMLLFLFNSAVSTMTLFQTEKRIDRDIYQLFSKFNFGSDYLKGTGGIFNGSFVVVIKDVAEADLQDIAKEFIENMNNILLKKKQNNFITKCYRGGFHMIPFPPFQTESFFEEIETLREDIISMKPLFNTGPMFRDTMKLLLAKLAINDFIPLDKQQMEARIKLIENDEVLAVRSDEKK